MLVELSVSGLSPVMGLAGPFVTFESAQEGVYENLLQLKKLFGAEDNKRFAIWLTDGRTLYGKFRADGTFMICVEPIDLDDEADDFNNKTVPVLPPPTRPEGSPDPNEPVENMYAIASNTIGPHFKELRDGCGSADDQARYDIMMQYGEEDWKELAVLPPNHHVHVHRGHPDVVRFWTRNHPRADDYIEFCCRLNGPKGETFMEFFTRGWKKLARSSVGARRMFQDIAREHWSAGTCAPEECAALCVVQGSQS